MFCSHQKRIQTSDAWMEHMCLPWRLGVCVCRLSCAVARFRCWQKLPPHLRLNDCINGSIGITTTHFYGPLDVVKIEYETTEFIFNWQNQTLLNCRPCHHSLNRGMPGHRHTVHRQRQSEIIMVKRFAITFTWRVQKCMQPHRVIKSHTDDMGPVSV